MACYLLNTKKDYTYVIESVSYWDKDSKSVKNTKKIIGKVDKNSGNIIFKEDFVNNSGLKTIKIRGQEIDITRPNICNSSYSVPVTNLIDTISNTIELNSVDNSNQNNQLDEILDNCKVFGVSYLLSSICDQINLTSILKDVFTNIYSFIIYIIMYLIASHDSMDNCVYWIAENSNQQPSKFSSQRISELFDKITAKERNLFYKKWIDCSKEDEFIALDITSIPTYSKTILDAEFGHSKNSDKMAQINICLLYGEKTYLPMYQTTYSGSINDVSTLSSTLLEFKNINGNLNINIVMDRGFFSRKNIEFILSQSNLRFLISVPFTNNFVKQLVKNVKHNIDIADNYIEADNPNEIIRGVHHFIHWTNNDIVPISEVEASKTNQSEILHAYIYYNPTNAQKERQKFFEKLNNIKLLKINNQTNINKDSSFDKYFIKNGNNSLLLINQTEVEEHLANSGFFILLSNVKNSPQDNFNIYRKRNVVEKAFNNWKQHLGLDRFHISGNRRMVNKSFILFLTQIVYSAIYKKMLDNHLFKKYTLSNVINEMIKMKSLTIDNKQYIRSISKTQKDILNSFNIKTPNNIDEN
ncbi:MAG: IS1634 family transposase [Deltaproteobacteria bacterium]|jgi:transposase|nr:IS1634 family transposase [Deltaproteobacteria bacterium]